jgi:heme/copper-type cytochrome/quinol oxidase subunit 1
LEFLAITDGEILDATILYERGMINSLWIFYPPLTGIKNNILSLFFNSVSK